MASRPTGQAGPQDRFAAMSSLVPAHGPQNRSLFIPSTPDADHSARESSALPRWTDGSVWSLGSSIALQRHLPPHAH